MIRPRCLAQSLGLDSSAGRPSKRTYVQSRMLSSLSTLVPFRTHHPRPSSAQAHLSPGRTIATRPYLSEPPPYRDPLPSYLAQHGQLRAPGVGLAQRSGLPKYSLALPPEPTSDDPEHHPDPYERPVGDSSQRPSLESLPNWVLPPAFRSRTGVQSPSQRKKAEKLEEKMRKEEEKKKVGLAGSRAEGMREFIRKSQTEFASNGTVVNALAGLGLDSLGDCLPGMAIPLMPHQVIGVDWMIKQEATEHRGGILADDMGLGKTVQMLAVMARDQATHPEEKQMTLVVAPLALLAQWAAEIASKSKPELFDALVWHGATRTQSLEEIQKHNVVITTYPLMQSSVEKGGVLAQNDWHRIILDEAHYIRNPITRSSTSAPKLKATHRWTLTGTPVFNKIDDLYPHFRFLHIDAWSDWETFDMIAKAKSIKDDVGKVVGNHDPVKLQVAVRSIMLRRLKDSMLDGKPILNLTELSDVTETLNFSPEERALYQMAAVRAADAFSSSLGHKGWKSEGYEHLLRLRQSTCHPNLLPADHDIGGWGGDEAQNNRDSEIAREVLGQEWVTATSEDLDSREWGPSGQACAVCSEPVRAPKVSSCCRTIVCAGCTHEICHTPHAAKYPVKVPEEVELEEGGTPKKRKPVGSRKKKVEEPTVEPASTRTTSTTLHPGFSCPTCHTHLDHRSGLLRAAAFMDDPSVLEHPDDDDPHVEGEDTVDPTPDAELEPVVPGTKMLRMLELVKEWSKEAGEPKIIIFSQWTTYLGLIERYLAQEGIDSVRYTGALTAKERTGTLKDFSRERDPNVLLMSVTAGGVGLNITRANKVIFMDLNWSPFVEKQAIARTHRIGQDKPVDVRHLVIGGTVEEHIMALQQKKIKSSESALGDGNYAMPEMTQEDMARLLGVTLPKAPPSTSTEISTIDPATESDAGILTATALETLPPNDLGPSEPSTEEMDGDGTLPPSPTKIDSHEPQPRMVKSTKKKATKTPKKKAASLPSEPSSDDPDPVSIPSSLPESLSTATAETGNTVEGDPFESELALGDARIAREEEREARRTLERERARARSERAAVVAGQEIDAVGGEEAQRDGEEVEALPVEEKLKKLGSTGFRFGTRSRRD